MRIRPAIPLLVALGVAAVSRAGGTRELDREDYISRLHGMWLAENIANHTGLTTEGTYKDPPFLTDAAWGTNAGSNGDLIDFVFYDPWPADDDTDIEYIYLYLMERHGVDLSALVDTSVWMAEQLGRPSPSAVVRALGGSAG